MAALGDKSGTADDHAPYPLHSAWVQVWRSPQRTSSYAAKLTPGRPCVKRGRVLKSPFLTP